MMEEDRRGAMTTKVERKSFKEGSNEVPTNMIEHFEEETAIDAVIGNNRRKNDRLHQELLTQRRNKCILIVVLFIICMAAVSTIAGPRKQFLDEYGYAIGNKDGRHKSDGSYHDHKGRDHGGSGSSGGGSVYHDEDEDKFEEYDEVKEDDLNDKYYDEDDKHELPEISEYDSEDNEGDDNNNKDDPDNIEDDVHNYNKNDEKDGEEDGEENDEENDEEDEEVMEGETTENQEKFESPEEEVKALIERVGDMTIGDLTKRFGNIDLPFKNNGYMIPFLFYIPRTGAALQEQMIVKCHGIVAATGREAIGDKHGDEPYLEVVETPSSDHYVNVDMRTPEGVNRAIDLNFVDSKLAGAIFATKIHLASEVFHPPYRGICFTFLRHPIDREVSLFYALKNSPWENSFKEEFSKMTLEDFAYSKYLESNWLTRMLTNKMSGPIDADDLNDAKIFLKTKCLIGLTDRLEESHDRMEKYFGWKDSGDEECLNELTKTGDQEARIRKLGEKIPDDIYQQIYRRNEFDIELYRYARKVYDAQEKFF